MSERKIRAIEAIAAEVAAIKDNGRKVVHCHGCFDLLHVGHIKHLQAARRMGDVLVVTVTPDRYVKKGPGRPAFNERLRSEALAALDCVDFVAIDRCPTAVEAIGLLKPNYFVKGQEFEARAELPPRLAGEHAAVTAAGGEVRFTHEMVFSSTSLLDVYGIREEAAPYLYGFRKRHSADEVLAGLDKVRNLRALVIGEAIIDEYLYAVPLGKSPKEAVVTTRHVRQERQAGGALACANHVAGFCDRVDLVTVLGEEASHETFVRSHLRSNVTPHFVMKPGAPTITKRRYMWDPYLIKLFEVALMDDSPLPSALEGELLKHLEAVVPAYDVVIVADYGHGFLGGRAADVLGHHSRFLAVNTQANAANFGFNLITKYPRLSYACIDEPEIRLALADRSSPVTELAETLRQRTACAAVSVTRGAEGALTCGADGSRWEVPVLSGAVVDRMGAGDAFLAVTSPCVASGMPLDVVAFLGSTAAALAVQIVGNRTPVDPESLGRVVGALLR